MSATFLARSKRVPRILPLLLIAALGPGCRRRAAPTTENAPFDLQTAGLDSGSPSNSFDGTGGSLSLGSGWARTEGSGRAEDPWSSYAWATSLDATLEFVMPGGHELDFFGVCLPFDFPSSPPQRFTPGLGDWKGPSLELRPDWQEVRFPLPDRPELEGRRTALTLHFDHLASPSKVGKGLDDRELAVAFSFAAIVPRGLASPRAFLGAAAIDPVTRLLRLPAGGVYTVPVPGLSRIDVHLGKFQGGCGGCSIGLDLFHPGKTGDPHWSSTPDRASNQTIPLLSAEGRPAFVRLRVVSGTAQTFDVRQKIQMTLPKNFVSARPLPGPSPKASLPRAPNLFIYLIDTMRADDLSSDGARRLTTPRINEFARDSVTYLHATATSSWTLGSTASLLTGVFPFRHQLITGYRTKIAPGVPFLASVLHAGGYTTFGISQSFFISPGYGFDDGFDDFIWKDELNGLKLRSQEIRRRLVDWLMTSWPTEKPLFAYVHTVDPHAPYTPAGSDRVFADATPGTLPESAYLPDEFMARGYGSRASDVAHLRALYDGEVLHADREFGRFVDLLKLLNLYEESVIVLVSDHGEEFGEHGGFDHGRAVFEELLHVPLVVKYPGGKWRGSAISERVSLADVAPTILDLAGIDRARLGMDGQNLTPPSAAEPSFRSRVLFSEIHAVEGPSQAEVDYKTATFSNLKCIHNILGVDQFYRPAPIWSVYDLSKDPGERAPLPAQSARFSRSVEILQRWLAAETANAPLGKNPPPGDRASREMIERMRSLGYLR